MSGLPAYVFLGAYAIVLIALAAILTLASIDTWLALLDRIKQSRRSARLKMIALQYLATIEHDQRYLPEITDTIRQALK